MVMDTIQIRISKGILRRSMNWLKQVCMQIVRKL